MTTTIINTHHATEYQTTKTPDQLSAIWLRAGQHKATQQDKKDIAEIRDALCGNTRCPFCGAFGERPQRNWAWNCPPLSRWEIKKRI